MTQACTEPSRGINSARHTLIRNRRLRYLHIHREYLNEYLHKQTPRVDEPPIGGRISGNLLQAYDYEQRIAQARGDEAAAAAQGNAVSSERVTEELDSSSEEESSSSSSNGDAEHSDKERVMVATQTFLAGQHRNVDYSAIDDDETLDDMTQIDRDAQDEFFAGEDVDPADHIAAHSALEGQTGVQDY